MNIQGSIPYYTQCISLGKGCEIAAAMNANGIRSFAGPFDWCISPFSSVIKIMDTGFSDFFQRENLVPSNENLRYFSDRKYEIDFLHDLKENQTLESEYEEISRKYKRRTDKFINAIKKPTVFIRRLDGSDITYINDNRQYIESVIKRGNPRNKIVFITMEGVDKPEWGASFHIPISCLKWDGDQYHFFDRPPELHNFICRLLTRETQIANYSFFCSESPISLLGIIDQALPVVKTSLTAFFSGRDWYVWGAGLYGSRLKEFLDTIGVRICGFIDSSPDKQGMNVGGIKIYGWKDIACEARNVFIAIKDRAATEQIKPLVHDTAPSVSVYGFADLTDYAVRRMA